jgi:hypothetical protein
VQRAVPVEASPTEAAAEGAAPVQEEPAKDFKITLERTSDDQALGLVIVDAAPALAVEGLKEDGLVPEFVKANDNTPDQHVKVGDRIIAVNGVSSDLEQMKKELAMKTVVLTMQRAAAVEAAPKEATAEGAAPAVQEEPAKEPEPPTATEEKVEQVAVSTEAFPEVAASTEGSDAVPAAPKVDAGELDAVLDVAELELDVEAEAPKETMCKLLC